MGKNPLITKHYIDLILDITMKVSDNEFLHMDNSTLHFIQFLNKKEFLK